MASNQSTTSKFLFTLFFLGCFALSVGFYLLYRGAGDGEVKDLLIPRGATLAKVSEILNSNQIIQHPVAFKVLLRLTGGNSKVRAGEFRFRTQMNALSALRVLYNDEPIVHQVTIPEGWTAKQIAEALAKANLVDPKKFIELALSRSGALKYGVKTPHLEGFLFPDTYAFSKIDGEEKILDRLVNQFFHHYKTELKAEADRQGMSVEKLVTLASIVEKETGNPNERNLVSSVFHNRLKKKMRLQSDPTTIYGIPNFNGNITKNDLKAYSPYNTYVIPGLPLGPIANPGLPALKATLNPAETDYLYFVSNNQGAHIFSKTYTEHARHVSGYQPALKPKTPTRKPQHAKTKRR